MPQDLNDIQRDTRVAENVFNSAFRDAWRDELRVSAVSVEYLAGQGVLVSVKITRPWITITEHGSQVTIDKHISFPEVPELVQEILAQDALKPYILAERLPGPDIRTDEDYFNFICVHSKTSHHCAGTCRMGSDADAVLDPRLRFNGIESLRVADASVMPTVNSSNTNAPSIMIGEKAADMIKQDQGLMQ